ncbi:helix-turn-helix transcriptional regulator [Bacteroides xylanisolvens]|nr:helix-turn-helix transcriptional regulator [Bacteroides xylanisolvens]
MEEIQELKDQVLEENRILEENRMKVGELNGKIVLLSMQNKTLSGLLKELGGELTVGPSSEQYISAFRLLLAIKEGTLRGKLSDGERYKLFSLFDLLYANYVTRLLDKAPLLTKRDLEICCFLKFGLTNEELARIFQTSSDSVTKAKGRLKGRLGISSQEDLNAFLRDF